MIGKLFIKVGKGTFIKKKKKKEIVPLGCNKLIQGDDNFKNQNQSNCK